MARQITNPEARCYVVDGTFDDANDARRFFIRAARIKGGPIVVDLRQARSISSTAWGAIAAGVRKLTVTGRDVVIFADVTLRRLLELSSVFRRARVVLSEERAA